MWCIDPKLLCKSHLLGSHFEIHKMIGNLKYTGKWTLNLTNAGYLEPQNAQQRHDELAEEMLKRGYKHESPLIINGMKLPVGHVDSDKSLSDLLSRCKECKRRYEKICV